MTDPRLPTRNAVPARWAERGALLLMLTAAAASCWAADALRAHLGRRLPMVEMVALLLAVPMAGAALATTTQRTNDTRQVADRWVREHVPPGRSILIKDAAFDILRGPWHFLFPLGSAGCVDARKVLEGHIRYSQAETYRTGRAVVDLGHVDDGRLDTCRTDYAVITHYAAYRSQPDMFGDELRRYRALLRRGRVVAVFRPIPNKRGGPVVYIVRQMR